MSPELIRRRLIVHGRVQGVFFRDSTREAAEHAGVAGYAVNRDDGTVEVVLEGRPEAVGKVADFCRAGPGHASVERVESIVEEPVGLEGFRIR
ncbi:MAG: acylphosphatase [Solirubrobacteraceae bacterium]